MDLETENRLATLLMEEARRMRQQADKEGVGIYLRDPKVRGRPNSRFLTATVLGVQQANRAVEVNEMWRAREKELELDNKLSHRSKVTAKYGGKRYHGDISEGSTSPKRGKPSADVSVSQSSRKHRHRDLHSEEYDGLKDEEVEEFLQSRMKRGRGTIGSRMDEPGPYPVCGSSDQDELLLVTHESSAGHGGKGHVLGSKKPSWLLNGEQHKVSPGRKSARGDHASRSRRRQSEDNYTQKKSRERRREEKSGYHHKH